MLRLLLLVLLLLLLWIQARRRLLTLLRRARKIRIGIIEAIIVILVYVQSGRLGVFYPERAAAGVNVTTIEHRLGPLGRLNVVELNHCLNPIFSEDDYAIDFAVAATDLVYKIARDSVMRIDHCDE